MMRSLIIIAILSAFLPCCMSFHDSLNFVLQPRSRQCFYENFDTSSPSRTVEAFVQSGGNVDVTLTIHGPLTLEDVRLEEFEHPLVQEKIDAKLESRSDTYTYVIDFKPKNPGTYGICLDNRESRFFPKIVQLDIRVASKPEPIVLKLGGDYSAAEEEELATKAKEAISRIRRGLTKIQVQQQHSRHRLVLHSEMNKKSHAHVLQGSIIETACFIGAALFQIFFVRRWFAAKTGQAKQWA